MYKIGEFSKLTGLTIRTLRYYDSIGLLSPTTTDRWTNYRLYTDEDVLKAEYIIFLKSIDFTLDEILANNESLSSEAISEKEEELIEKRNIIDYQLECLKILKGEENTKNNIVSFSKKLSNKKVA